MFCSFYYYLLKIRCLQEWTETSCNTLHYHVSSTFRPLGPHRKGFHPKQHCLLLQGLRPPHSASALLGDVTYYIRDSSGIWSQPQVVNITVRLGSFLKASCCPREASVLCQVCRARLAIKFSSVFWGARFVQGAGASGGRETEAPSYRSAPKQPHCCLSLK